MTTKAFFYQRPYGLMIFVAVLNLMLFIIDDRPTVADRHKYGSHSTHTSKMSNETDRKYLSDVFARTNCHRCGHPHLTTGNP